MSKINLPTTVFAALMTGRSELVQEPLSVEAARDLVQSLLTERENLRMLMRNMDMMVSNLRGAANACERMESAMVLAVSGATPEAVEDALANPNWKD